MNENKLPIKLHVFPKSGIGEPWCGETTWVKTTAGRDYHTIKLSVEWLMELFGL